MPVFGKLVLELFQCNVCTVYGLPEWKAVSRTVGKFIFKVKKKKAFNIQNAQ